MIDLKIMLKEIIDQYGENKGYLCPNIRWSTENMTSRFGEFQYWCNSIVISNLLNTDKVSADAIKSVIYHEYAHQQFSNHSTAFEKRMKKFPEYHSHLQKLEQYFDSLEELPQRNCLSKEIVFNDKTIFCLLPSSGEDTYLSAFLYVNHCHYINCDVKRHIDQALCTAVTSHVIWLVESETEFAVAGWSNDVMFFETAITTRNKQYGGFDYTYRAKVKQSDSHIMLPINMACVIPQAWFPQAFKKDGVCAASEIDGFSVADVFGYIKTYDCDFIEMNTDDRYITAVAPLAQTSVSKVIAMSRKELNDRGIWLANLAIKMDPSYDTYLTRAEAFQSCCIYDLALKDYLKALTFKPDDAHTEKKIQKIRQMLKNC